MNKYLNFSIFLAGILFFWLIQTPTSFAHPDVPAVGTGRGGFTCTNAPGHILIDNQCIHPTEAESAQLQEAARSVAGPDTEAPSGRFNTCPVGYNLDTAANLCRKIICPTGQFYDTNNKRCALDTLSTGQLNIETSGYTPYICFKEGRLPTVGEKCPEQKLQEGIAQYIARIYQFSLMVVGLLALAGLTLGAVKYVLSAGNIVNQEDARDQMKAAVIGLLILLGAYLILNTINPDLITLENPGILNLPPTKDTSGATPGKPNAITPTQAPSATAGQKPAASGARYPTQTGCARNSQQYIVVIKSVEYWACFAAASGYNNIDGVVTPIR